MGNFQRNDRGGNRNGGFRGGRDGGRQGFGGGRGGDRGPVTMHKAVCDKCHKDCEVPFRPSSDKPIYCNECFGGKRDGGDRGPKRDFGNKPRREFNDRPTQSNSQPSISADVKKQLDEMNNKLDRLVVAIESLTASQKPQIKVKEDIKVAKTPAKKVAVKSATKSQAKKVVSKKKK